MVPTHKEGYPVPCSHAQSSAVEGQRFWIEFLSSTILQDVSTLQPVHPAGLLQAHQDQNSSGPPPDFLRLFFMCLTCPSTSKLGDLSPTTWFYWSTLGKLVYHLFVPTCGTLMEKNYPSTSLLTESHFMREIKLLSHPLLPIYLPVCLAQDVPNAGRASNSHQVAGTEYRCSLLLPVQLK